MITTALLSFFAWLLNLVFSPWPKVTELPSPLDTVVSQMASLWSSYSLLPVLGTVVQIGTLVLTFLVSWQLVVFANWLYNKIRGSG